MYLAFAVVQNAELAVKMRIFTWIVYQEIINFIKKHNRIVYGGYAINELIRAKNEKDVFYKTTDIADIEFYSPTPLEDLIELTEQLYSKKFEHIEASGGQHDGTYKIFVNLDFI